MTEPIDWNTKTLEERAEHIGAIIDTRTDTVQKIGECLDMALASHNTGYEGHVAAIVGATREGKTTGFLVWASKVAKTMGGSLVSVKTKNSKSVECVDYITMRDGPQEIRPVLCVGVGPSPTYNGLLMDTILAITRTVPKGRPTHGKLVNLLREQIIAQKVRVLVFDEVHRIARSGSVAGNNLAGDVFSTLAKQTKVEIVLIGREGLSDLFSDNEELVDMTEQEFEIIPEDYPLQINDPYMTFVKKFEKNLPFNMPSDLGGLAGAQLIHRWVKGSPGPTALLLGLATKYAVIQGLPCVTLTVIGNALAKHKNVKPNKNIFLSRPDLKTMQAWADEAELSARKAPRSADHRVAAR